MAVTLDDIAARLGVATPTLDSPKARQWQAWIEDAQFLVEQRASVIGVDPATLDPATVDRVVTLAVVAMARKPDDSSQLDVAVDDGRVSKRWTSSAGRVDILDEWWGWLGLATVSGAFSVRPHFVPDGASPFSDPYPIAGAVDVIPPISWP